MIRQLSGGLTVRRRDRPVLAVGCQGCSGPLPTAERRDAGEPCVDSQECPTVSTARSKTGLAIPRQDVKADASVCPLFCYGVCATPRIRAQERSAAIRARAVR